MNLLPKAGPIAALRDTFLAIAQGEVEQIFHNDENVYERIRKHANHVLGMGLIVYLLIGIASLYGLCVTEGTPASIKFLTVVCFAAFGVLFYRGAQISIDYCSDTLSQQRTHCFLSWLPYGVGQFLLIMLIESIFFKYTDLHECGHVLFTLVSPQIACFLTLRMTLFLVFLLSIPLTGISIDDYHFTLFSTMFVFHIILVGFIKTFMNEMNSQHELICVNGSLRQVQLELAEKARLGERLRISRDLHDRMGHHLIALGLQLEIAHHLSEGEVKKEIERSRQLTKNLLKDVREVVGELRAENELPFTEQLNELIARVEQVKPGLEIQYSQPDLGLPLPKNYQTLLIELIKESVTNCIKHANAHHLKIIVQQLPAEVKLCIEDDGQGAGDFRYGNGLKGMKERLMPFQGRMIVNTDAMRGFKITISVPLNQHVDKAVSVA